MLFIFNGHTCSVWKMEREVPRQGLNPSCSCVSTSSFNALYQAGGLDPRLCLDPSCCCWILFFCFLFCLFWATPMAYGNSQVRGLIGAAPTSLRHSHSNLGSEPHLQPMPQLMAMPDREPTEQGQGSNPHPHGRESGSLTAESRQELLQSILNPLRHSRNSSFYFHFRRLETIIYRYNLCPS